ncbi:MAG TPA: hypothetical protein DCX95_01155 [Elusimicrobia bacterium]|nr:hypothetical protein [Elusimicrobiota bacterium]
MSKKIVIETILDIVLGRRANTRFFKGRDAGEIFKDGKLTTDFGLTAKNYLPDVQKMSVEEIMAEIKAWEDEKTQK